MTEADVDMIMDANWDEFVPYKPASPKKPSHLTIGGSYFKIIGVTSTNLIVKTVPRDRIFIVLYDYWDPIKNNYKHITELNDEFAINPDRITNLILPNSHDSYFFTPVTFTNQLNGFQIHHLGNPNSEPNVFYVALSDIPVDVGEADVETMME